MGLSTQLRLFLCDDGAEEWSEERLLTAIRSAVANLYPMPESDVAFWINPGTLDSTKGWITAEEVAHRFADGREPYPSALLIAKIGTELDRWQVRLYRYRHWIEATFVSSSQRFTFSADEMQEAVRKDRLDVLATSEWLCGSNSGLFFYLTRSKDREDFVSAEQSCHVIRAVLGSKLTLLANDIDTIEQFLRNCESKLANQNA